MRSRFFPSFLAVFLALSLFLSCLPLSALAADASSGSRLPEELDRLIQIWSILRKSQGIPDDLSLGDILTEELLPEEPLLPATADAGTAVYFGQLHGHTDISSGTGSADAVYSHAAGKMDFFAVTDNSDSITPADWAAGKAAAAAASGAGFLGLYGYEMNWPAQLQIGHISVFGSDSFHSWQEPPYNVYNGSLEAFYASLAANPTAIGLFSHPGTQYGNFQDFSLRTPEADRAMNLLEIDFSLKDPCRYYLQALNAGWHVAPTASQDIYTPQWEDTGIRTAVLAQDLTEESIYDSLRAMQTYATEDPDLQIRYSMNGFPMGSSPDLRYFSDFAEISVSLSDPTDAAIGTVEVVSSAGVTSQYLAEASSDLTFSLPPEPGYYFLRITQPDGHRAVTAPIWIDADEDLDISLTCDTPVPMQGEPVTLTAWIANGENTDFLVESLEILADGRPVAEDTELTVIPAGTTLSRSLTFTCDCVGLTEITLRLTGSLEGGGRMLEESLTLSFHQAQQVTAIAIDSGHGNAGLNRLTLLQELAVTEHIDVRFLQDTPTAGDLKNCRFLLISAPAFPFDDAFVSAVAEYAAQGGSLVICGQADSADSGFHSAAELNRLLAAVGASARIRDDRVQDDVTNGGAPELIYADSFNLASPWCAGIRDAQVYRHAPGCSVDPGSGVWLVQGRSTGYCTDADGDGLGGGSGAIALLTAETLAGGGTVFSAGSLFCDDSAMTPPGNIWDDPYANRTIMQTLLGIGGEAVPLSTVWEARTGPEDQLFRIRGYVTAGTSNPYNTFPGTLYLQDDTGGIAVVPFTETGIQAGTALEVTGYAQRRNGNRVLKLSSWEILDAPMYLYEAVSADWQYLLDPDLFGGAFVQVEGLCMEIYCREDGTLAGCLLRDENNRLATVKIEDGIGNGSDGGNDLHRTIRRGRTVRAMGILHIDEYGDTVIRVRNCEEMVWVPALRMLNPKTADSRLLPLIPMTLSLLGLLLLTGRKVRYRGRYLK